MKREIITTADGSHSMQVPEWKVSYHSHHGALQESLHVFVEAGLRYWLQSRSNTSAPVHIFEMGFGTGLNAFLTLLEAAKTQTGIHYTAIELSPLTKEEITALNYPAVLGNEALFYQLHQCSWEEAIAIINYFTLQKINSDLTAFQPLNSQPFHIIYYDAFAPLAQPELWTEEVFRKLHSMMATGGILVTYCSKGVVRRALQAAGFMVQKLPGPKGKREMVRAEKA